MILAGGLGTRLGKMVSDIPKPMIRINGIPFMEYQINLLRENNIVNIILCVGYLHEQIVDYFGDGTKFGVKIGYSIEREKLLGTAGAVRNAYTLLEKDFLLMYGDSYLPIDFSSVYHHFKKIPEKALMTVYKNDTKWDTSNIVFQGGKIVIYNKMEIIPEMNYIDYGLMLFSKEIIETIPEYQYCNLDKLQFDLVQRGEMAGFEVIQRFYEIGSTRGFSDFTDFVTKKNL
ncbi:MAG: NTP transferase domain-containing protein [Bacteroidetes bacterium]|nr:NTP transferase domain-containing protein [Bacteroidota bacterium]